MGHRLLTPIQAGCFCFALIVAGSAQAAARPHYKAHAMVRSVYHSRYHSSHHRAYSSYKSHYLSTFDPTLGDQSRFDDPIVRGAAIRALGHRNGSVLAVDPRTGRILTIVNQKLALSPGFEPCSTIKPVIAVAALQEGIINRDSTLAVGRRQEMDLTEALAHSNNEFFAELGERLGFETVRRYASLFGLGEKAGLNVAGEKPGALPAEPPARGGVGRMSSFGEGIRITPLQLASLTSAVANGGTIYYLQYPHSEAALEGFSPVVKRRLNIASELPDVRDGMLAAVLYGTAKRSYDPDGAQALGKTGTCDDETRGGRLGWFTTYADQENPRIALVVLLRGWSRSTSGPEAAEVAGKIYKSLSDQNYFKSTQADAAAFSPDSGTD